MLTNVRPSTSLSAVTRHATRKAELYRHFATLHNFLSRHVAVWIGRSSSASNQVWVIRLLRYSVHIRNRRVVAGYSTVRRGSGVFQTRLGGGLPFRNLSGDNTLTRRKCQEERISYIIGFRRMERRREKSFCFKPFETVETIEERIRENGITLGVPDEYPTRGSFTVHGYPKRLLTLPTVAGDARLVIFRYDCRYYQCLALPFEWGRSPLRFTQPMVPFVMEIRLMGYRVLSYLDDFRILPSAIGTVASFAECAEASGGIEKLLRTLGLERHPLK